MDQLELVLTICLYILSIVTALILGMISRRLSEQGLRLGLSIHVALIALTVVFLFAFPEAQAWHYTMLLAVCTGLSLSGWILRSSAGKKIVKAYFGVFLLSIPVFLWSPSLLFYSISGHLSEFRPELEFHLGSNTYLTEQQSMLNTGRAPTGFKVIRKYGIYNKTLVRNLNFGQTPLQARLEEIRPDSMVIHATLANGRTQSIGFKPGMKKNSIVRKPVQRPSLQTPPQPGAGNHLER